MFYSSHVLTKKGPLAKIWLAAHMQSKLTKAMIFATDITKAVETIFSPDAPMALRLSSNLLLGVARILCRKTKYLIQDSTDALNKLKTTYRPSAAQPTEDCDLPSSNVSFAAVTLATPHADEMDMPAPMIDLSQIPQRPRTTSHNYLAAERDITIDEFAGGLSGGILDAFADNDFGAGSQDLGIEHLAGMDEPLVFTPSQRYQPKEKPTPSVRSAPSSVEVTRAAPEGADASPEAPMLSIERDGLDEENRVESPDEMRDAQMRPPAPPMLDDDISPVKPGPDDPVPMPEETENEPPSRPPSGVDVTMDDAPEFDTQEAGPSSGVPRISTGSDELVLAEEDEEEAAENGGETQQATTDGAAPTKRGRKRKRVIVEDEATELSVEEFRRCLNDTSDLVLHPRARRRGADRVRGRRPMTYEDLLARPTIGLAPQLSELFAQSFHFEEARQLGSPMSDADLNKDGRKEVDEEAADAASGMQTPEKTVTPQKPVKEVVADPEITPQHRDEAEGGIGLSQSAAKSDGLDLPSRKTDEVPSSPVQDEMPLGETPDRRLSLGTDSAVPMPVGEDEAFYDPVRALDFDKTKISLQDVAKTRSQVIEDGRSRGEAEDVTENTISARTQKMQEYIVTHLDEGGELNYSEKLAAEPGMSRRTAARSFYELLNLSSKKALQLSQDGPYGTIKATPLQPVFDSLRS